MRLKGKVALVTGAAGGIGYAVTELFDKEGAMVVAADIREPSAPYPGCVETMPGILNAIASGSVARGT